LTAASPRALHVAILLWVGILWGVQPAFIKAAVGGALTEIESLALTLLAVSASIGAYLLASGRFMTFNRRTVKFTTLNGFLEYAAPLLTAFIVAKHIDAGLLTLIMATTPIFTVALAAAIRSEALSRETLLACLVGLAAMALIVIPENALPSRDMLPWCLAAFGVPMFYACGSTWVSRNWPPELDTTQAAFSGALGAAIFLIPFWVKPLAAGTLFANTGSANWALAALIVSVVLEMQLYMYLLRHAGAVFTSFSSFVMIASGFIAGALLFGERPSAWVWASVALFAISLALIIKAPRKVAEVSDTPGQTPIDAR
jgi:drug/metabolite transporter (DMT)-like permease